MIKDITLGQYISGQSLLHKADPRVKIVLLAIFMVAIFQLKDFIDIALFSLFTLIIISSSNVPFKFVIKGLRPIFLIIIFTTLINIFTIRGTTIFQYGVIQISKEGIEASLLMTFRLILLITNASLLTLTTTPISLTDGIEKLMNPLKKVNVPVHEIAMMMSIALRFIPTLLEETEKIMKAQSARGADFDTGNLINRAKSFVPILVPLFISAFRRADELATAMEARCYRGSEGRTRMKQLKITSTDFIISAVLGAFLAFYILLKILV